MKHRLTIAITAELKEFGLRPTKLMREAFAILDGLPVKRPEGKPRKSTDVNLIRTMRERGMTIRTIAAYFGVGRQTIANRLKESQ